MKHSKDTGPKFPASIRVKCTEEFKASLDLLAGWWTDRKGQDYDMSKVLRELGERAIAREDKLNEKRRKRGQA